MSRLARIILRFLPAFFLVGAMLVSSPLDSHSKTKKKASTTASTKTSSKKSTKKTSKTSSGKTAKKSSKKTSGSAATTSNNVSDVKKQQEQTQTEIKKTKEEIAKNEQEVKKSLAELRQIEGQIKVSQGEVDKISSQLNIIKNNISTLETSIDKEEKELEHLRGEYLKAVKKMRVAKKKSSELAFLFSAKNFNEAKRRMRYMKEFSAWKDKQSAEILSTVEALKANQQKLLQAKADADLALGRQLAAKTKLEKEQNEQAVIVSGLKANGEALKSHLAAKQAEANQLNARISELIAREQAKAAEEKRLAEEKRKAEEKRLAEERRKAEEQRLAEEKRQAESQRKADEQKRKEEALANQNEPKKKEDKKKNEKGKNEQVAQATAQETGSDGSYASARKRKPRSDAASSTTTAAGATSAPSSTTAAAKTASGFEGMKGSLPRPVNGTFNIITYFGRQSVAGMPDVYFDNPGIDAHVASGATANAVYEGSVAGVYEIPGYQHAIVVKHGDYYTIYANVSAPSVKTGDKVSQGQSLGRLGIDPDDSSHNLIHFEVWKNQTKLNPSSWIR